VHVLTVLPGFVDTKMTEGLDLPERLTATPEEVAASVVKSVIRRRNVVYVKPVWQLIMTIIRLLPEPVFKKTSL
jgi:short-subunit dehydrogenase